MPHSSGKHEVVEHEDQGLIRAKSGTRVLGIGGTLIPSLVLIYVETVGGFVP